MRRPKAVLLDFDDTLADNSVIPASLERACDDIARAVGTLDAPALLQANVAAWNERWPRAERRCWVGEMDVLDVSRDVWRQALLACGHDDPAVGEMAHQTHQRIGREMARLYDDVPGCLAALRAAGIATALVTNSSHRSQLARIEAVGLGSAFDAVVISGEVGVAKPDAGIFAVALDRLSVANTEAWHVGDSLSTDVAGAAAAGIFSAWLNRGGRPITGAGPRPGVEIDSLRRLHELLLLD